MSVFSTPVARKRALLAQGIETSSSSSSSSLPQGSSSVHLTPVVVNEVHFPIVGRKPRREDPAYEDHFHLSLRKRNPFAYLHEMGGEQYQEISKSKGKKFRRTLRKEQKAKRVERSRKRQPIRSFNVMETSPSRMSFFSNFAELFPFGGLNDETFRGYLTYNHREARYEPSSVETSLTLHSLFLGDEEYSVIVQLSDGVPLYRQIVGNYCEGHFRTEEDLHLTKDEEENEKRRRRLERRNKSRFHCYVYSYRSSACGDNHFEFLANNGETWSSHTLHRLSVKRTYLGEKIPVSASRKENGDKTMFMELRTGVPDYARISSMLEDNDRLEGSHADIINYARAATIARGKYYPYIGQFVERNVYVDKILVASFCNSAKGFRHFEGTSIKPDGQGGTFFQNTTLFFGLDMTTSITALTTEENPLIAGHFVINKRSNEGLRRRRISDKIFRRNPDISLVDLRRQTNAVIAAGPTPRPRLFRTRYLAGVSRKHNNITTESIYRRPGSSQDLSYELKTSEDGMTQTGTSRRNGEIVSQVVKTLGEDQMLKRVVTTKISGHKNTGMYFFYGGGRKKIVRVHDRSGHTKTTYIHSSNREEAGYDDIDHREKRSYSNGVVTWEKYDEVYSYTANNSIPLMRIDTIEYWPETYVDFTRQYVNCLFLGSLPREIHEHYGLREGSKAVYLQMWQCLWKHNLSIYRSLSDSHDLSLILESPAIFLKHNTGDIVDRKVNQVFSNGERVTSYPIRAIIFEGRKAKLASELSPEMRQEAFVPYPISIEGIREYFGV